MTVAGIELTSHRTLAMAGVVLAILAAWIGLAMLHGPNALALESLAALCTRVGTPIGLALYPGVLAMWLLMAVAMMLPTALPTIDLYVQLSRRMESGRTVRIVLFIAGYLVAWGVFGAIAALGQIALHAVPTGNVAPGIAAGAVLLLAGGYQLSPLKQSCLDLCRNPMLFFMSRWRDSLGGTLRLGAGHGLVCVGCCWALMLLMFLAGAMNLVWMALLGLVMLAEKTLPRAPGAGRVAGVLMICAGAVTIGATLV